MTNNNHPIRILRSHSESNILLRERLH